MVTGFRRSISLPMSHPSSPGPKCHTGKVQSHHVRSTSLPCRSHPIISQLEDEIRTVRAWQCMQPHEPKSPAWICDGLAQLELLHASLHDILNLPQTQDSLRRVSAFGWTDRIQEDFLHFADAHGSFRSTIVALKQHLSTAQVAIRRRDDARLASCVRSQKKTEKELVKLASSLRNVAKLPSRFASGAGEVELAGLIREVIIVTVSMSESIFLGIAGISSVTSAAVASSSSLSGTPWIVGSLRRLASSPSSKKRFGEDEGEACRGSLLERLEELEECIRSTLESRSERVFGSLVNTRVSLLNILTPSM